MTRARMAVVVALLVSAKGVVAEGAEGSRKFTLPSGVEVTLLEAPFRAGQFRVSGCKDEGPACLINGHIPFGRTANLPRTYVSSLTISFGGRTYALNASDMYDAWGERPLEYPGKVRYFGGRCEDARNCQVRGLFSDASGTFVGEWRVVDGVPIRTVLTDSNDVVSLFMTHIDPPAFE